MPVDKLDIKAREAAEQHNAGYSEEAWNKMEALLDKHMPVNAAQPAVKQKKFHEKWLFLLLSLVAISFVVLLIKPWQNNGKTNMPIESTGITKGPESNSSSNKTATKPGSDQEIAEQSNFNNSSTNNSSHGSNVSKANGKTDLANVKEISAGDQLTTFKTTGGRAHAAVGSGLQSDAVLIEPQTASSTESFINQKIDNKPIEDRNIIINKISLSSPQRIDAKPGEVKTIPRSTRKNKFANSFSLSVSAGPDVSAINANNLGRLETIFGVGVGYKFADRLQVRTGVYTAKKVYEAKPSDYNPPSMFWGYYPDLQDIDANCKVIEIPLILNYSFSQKPKHTWFGSAGISSYIMKRETYHYTSKNASGWAQYTSYTIRNENKHYLSSLRLSAGYETRLNKTISLSAEPYLNLPLSGIGYGKVKLNSAGLLFSISIKPFAKK